MMKVKKNISKDEFADIEKFTELSLKDIWDNKEDDRVKEAIHKKILKELLGLVE